MKKITISLLVCCFLLAASPVKATSLTTDQASSSGQVMFRNQDGTMYLTTETVGGSDSSYSANRRIQVSRTLITPPTGFATDLGKLINALLSGVMVICALLVFLFLVWGALAWIMSGGDKGKTESARNKITSAVIGLIIVSASYAVLTLVIRFLGFASLNDVFNQTLSITGPTATESAKLK